MNIRPKTVRRLVILLAGCGLIAVAAASVLYYSHRSKERQMQAARTEGMDAFKSENYPAALDKLRSYISKHPNDYDALYAMAVARSRVETTNGRHLLEAKTLFEQLHGEKPDDMQVSHHLLQVYEQMGYFSEAQHVADEVLAQEPKDVEALRIKTSALAGANKYNEALVVSQKLNDADPMDIDGQIQTLDLLRLLKHAPGEIVARYQALQTAHPDDPRFEMMLGLAYLDARDQANALKWLRTAAQRTPPNAAFVQRMSRCFDNLKLFDESRDLLERAAANGNHPDVVKILVERLWENGQYQSVVDRLASLDSGVETTDGDLLAFKALSLYQLDKSSDADSIVAALKQRTGDSKSAAWAQALTTRYGRNITPRSAIKQYQSALARAPENAIIRCWIGEAYLQLGETDVAMQQWRQALEQMPSWAHPGALLARAELKRGMTDQALHHAVEAMRRAPNSVEAAIAMALASYQHLLQSPDKGDIEKLIQFVSDIQRGLPGEPQTLPLLADLQARAGQRDNAIATIKRVVNAPTTQSSDLLLELADVSRRQNLGIDQEILARLPADASQSPRLALERALDLAHAGKHEQGKELLADHAAGGADARPISWKVALAEYLEATGDPAAKSAWIALGDENQADIKVQNLILKEAHSAEPDRAFFLRTIDRLHDLTGDDALGWKFAKARYLLTSDDKQRDSADAVAILRQLVGQSPDTPEYRVLLAAGLINLGDVNGAIDHLKAAAERESAGVDGMLDLIKMLLSQNRAEEARTYMDRATKSASLTPANRKPLAVLLAQQGQLQQAIGVLAPAVDSLDEDGKLLYVELLRRHGDVAVTEALYSKLLAEPAPSAAVISSAADFFASTDRLDQARQIIARLGDARFDQKLRILQMSHFNELYVSKDVARELLLNGTKDAPADADLWRALVEFDIRDNRFSDAVAAANQALTKLPNNESIATLKAQASALATTASGQSDLRPLIDALGKDPKNAAQVEMLKTIQDARTTKQTPREMVAKLKVVADKYPNYWPLQSQLARTYVDLGQPNDAAAVVERLMDTRPGDLEPAKLAVSIYRAAGRYRDMKRAAEKLRQRTLEHPVDADTALAEAALALGDAKAASDQLAPYLKSVSDQPQHAPALTAAVAKMWVVTNKIDDVNAMLQPLLSQGPVWRRLYLALAAGNVTPASTAADWIRTAASAIPKDAWSEQFTLAQAWQQMGARLNDKDAIGLSRDLLRGLIDRPELGADPIAMLASLETDAGEFSAAESLYRRAVAMDPNLADAQNNLAYILLTHGGDLNEAKDFATRAITLSPTTSAFHDTLARIDEALDNRDGAQSEFAEALRLDPTSVDARIGLSRSLRAAGNRDKAQQELQHIDTQLNGVPPTNEQTRRELQSLRESLSSSGAAE